MPIAYEFDPDLVISKSFFCLASILLSFQPSRKLTVSTTQFLPDSMLRTETCSVNVVSPLQLTDI